MEADFETLRSLAEVAVAFAGFAALAGVIGDRSNTQSKHNLVRLQAVVYSSVIVVASAYAPIVTSRYGLSDRETWQIASAIALPLNWVGLVAIMRLGQRSGLHRVDRWFTRVGYGLEVPVELPLIANLFMVFPVHAPALYLTSLISVLCQTAIAFVLLVSNLLRPDSDETGC